jgi:hypothetical protein
MITRGKRVLIACGVLVVAWFAVVTVQIATEPEVGVDSPAELQDRLQLAFNTQDARGLEDLVAYPPDNAEDFATAYIAEFKAAGVHSLTVTLLPGLRSPRSAAIRGLRADGTDFSYLVSVRERGGKWRVELTPPL